MVAAGYHVPAMRAHLMGTVALFESSHQALKRGHRNLNLPAAQSEAMAAQLAVIERHWEKLAEIFRRVAEGGNPVEADLKRIASDSGLLLAELNHAVERYESVDIPSNAAAISWRR